ncbi:MAG: tyrosine-type recombinase/integrase [Microcoleus sp.]
MVSIRRDITTTKLLTIWKAYSKFRRPQISPSTHEWDYQKVERFIARKIPEFNTSIQIKNWCNQHYSHETARRRIQQFNAACEWAKCEGLHSHNPFEGLTRYFQPKKQSRSEYKAFTQEEKTTIITHFDRWDSFYSPWVKFLFYTGCRPSEAAAMRWKHIHPQFESLEFVASLRCDTHQGQGTKSAGRTFPVGEKLRRLLWELQTKRESPETLLFQGLKGESFNYAYFQTKHWKPHLERLLKDGAIAQVLSQYHCRHTWITQALENGYSVADVAYLSGNTPGVIHTFYASRNRMIEAPDF